MINTLNTHYLYHHGDIHLHLQNYLKTAVPGLVFDLGNRKSSVLVSPDLDMVAPAALVLQQTTQGLQPLAHLNHEQAVTFSLCGMVEREKWSQRHPADPVCHDLKAAIAGVQQWNRRHKRTPTMQIAHHRFYAPYRMMHDHWSSAVLDVVFVGEQITEAKWLLIDACYSIEVLRDQSVALIAAMQKQRLFANKINVRLEGIATQQQQDATSSGVIAWLTMRDAITHGLDFVRHNRAVYPTGMAEQRKADIESAFHYDSEMAATIIMRQSDDDVYSRLATQQDEITVRQVVGMDEAFVQFVEQNIGYNELVVFNLAADELLEETIVARPAASAAMKAIRQVLCQALTDHPGIERPIFWPYLFSIDSAQRLRYNRHAAVVNLIWLLISWKMRWLASQQPWPLPKGWAIDKEIARQRQALEAKRSKRAAAKKQWCDKQRQALSNITTMQDMVAALSPSTTPSTAADETHAVSEAQEEGRLAPPHRDENEVASPQPVADLSSPHTVKQDTTVLPMAQALSARLNATLARLAQKNERIAFWLHEDILGSVYAQGMKEIIAVIARDDVDSNLLIECIRLEALITWSVRRKHHLLTPQAARRLLTYHRAVHDVVMQGATTMAYISSISQQRVQASMISVEEQKRRVALRKRGADKS